MPDCTAEYNALLAAQQTWNATQAALLLGYQDLAAKNAAAQAAAQAAQDAQAVVGYLTQQNANALADVTAAQQAYDTCMQGG